MKRISLVLSIVLFAVGFTMAQRTVMGTVTDQSGEALIGATVQVKGTTTGTVTDIDGKYSVTVPEGANTLVFSYTGYTTQEVALGASNVVDVTLEEGVTLETAVVTALGIQREEKAVGYAVQEVGGDDVVQTNTTNMIDALSGKSAGVYVNQSAGTAGASSRIVLRGQTSLGGNNQALIVIDGVRIDNSETNSERGLYGVANSNRGIDINPNDIESVTVLKGAAASALYGVEGARGVLLITTKKGKAGKGVDVTLQSNFTASEVTQMPEQQESYAQGISGTWFGAETGAPWSWGPAIDTLYWDGASDYDWDKNGRIVGQSDPDAQTKVTPYDNIGNLFQTGRRWNNNVSFSGGNEASNYRFSFGALNEEGVIPLNTFDRYNIGFTSGASMFDGKLDAQITANFVNSSGRRIQQGSNTSGIMLGLLRTPPTFDNSNGFGEDAVDEPSAYQFADGSQRNYRGGGGYDNPYWVINNAPFFDNVNRLYGSAKLAYHFSPWATLSTTVGTDFYSDNRKQQFELGSRTFPGGQVFEDQYNYSHIDAYINLLGGGSLSEDFSLNYNVGVNFWNSELKQNYIQGDGLNFFGFPELSNTTSINSFIDNNNERNFSVFGSVDVGFRNFLYLTLTGRNDWLSTLIVPSRAFNAGDISVFYPSASLSFVFTELMEPSSVLSFGKIRGSYAQVGGGAPTPYLTGTIFTVPNQTGLISSVADGWTNGILFPFLGTPGVTYNPLQGAINLIPSTTTDIEVGADLRFLNDRIGLDVTYYTRKSEDQIIASQVPSSTGFQRAVINSGELETTGAEVVLNINPVRTRDFNWDIGLNFSTWNTLVKSLPEGVPNQYLEGFASVSAYNVAPVDGEEFEYGQLLGLDFQRANNADGTAFDPALPYNPDGALIIDDSGSSDPNADDYNSNYGYPLVDPNTRVLGNPNPDFLLGINNTLTYKDLSLSFLWDIKEGGDMWNGTKGAMTFFGISKLTEDRDALNAEGNSDYENATNIFDGVLASSGAANNIAAPLDENWYTGNGGGFGSVSSHFIEDGSYMRLRYVTLSYNFRNLLKDVGLSDVTLSLTGRNLILLTDYEGVDPETSLIGSGNGQGMEYFQAPGTRSYAVGLNVKF